MNYQLQINFFMFANYSLLFTDGGEEEDFDEEEDGLEDEEGRMMDRSATVNHDHL